MDMNFSKEKNEALEKSDLSRKGSIDNRINELIHFINSLNSYFTTSSCSGRIIIFTNSEFKKKGCEWIFVSHNTVSTDDIIKALEIHSGSAVLKFEPFVLHARCATMEEAKILLQCGIQSGFKNSGISIGKSGKIIVAIRSTLSLEVPLMSEGALLVSNEYISYVVNICNGKMVNNWERIERFFIHLKNFQHISNHNVSKVYTTEQASCMKSNKSLKRSCDEESESCEQGIDLFFEGFTNLINESSN